MTLLTGYNGILKVTNSNIKFYFARSISNEDGFIQITKPPGTYEIESLNNEIRMIIFDEELLQKLIIRLQSSQILQH